MEIFWIVLGVLAFLILGGLIPMLIYTWPLSKKVYHDNLVRTSPEKWGRVCSAPDNEEQVAMWEAGLAWAQPRMDHCREVQIQNDGLHLFGQYFDFGHDKCVIILPGRCECLIYSYYFAAPYERAGFNVLVIDSRCHGKSDGIYSTAGVKESSDVTAWARFAQDQLGCKELWFHGICIGTAAGIGAMNRADCPEIVKGLVTEGCFVSLRETFKRHMIADKRPLFPVLDLIMLHLNRATGINIYRDTPINAMKKLDKKYRLLFLYGEKDIFSIPEMSKKLFAACAAEDKKLVWFDKGGHSHLRINNTEKYDDTIVTFLKS
jgi:pimeloyl-ACP methyl ester carboxylesterase